MTQIKRSLFLPTLLITLKMVALSCFSFTSHALKMPQPATEIKQSQLAYLQLFAEQGDHQAAHLLGVNYLLGQDVKQDIVQGIKWLNAAAQSHQASQELLATLYFDGQLLKKDFKQAQHWYQQLADKGEPLAHFRLGMMYLQGGHGITRHCGLAIDHFTSVGNAISLANAAWVMATCPEARYRNGSRALEISHALWLEDQHNPALLDQLAAAYAENGNFIDAITMQQQAIQVLDKRQLQTLAQFEKRLGYYQARKPFRDQFDD